jgi:ryanodine receptor 2
VGSSETPERQDDADSDTPSTGMPPGLLPTHKSAVVLFLERVYGVENQQIFFRLLEDCFLPDMRAATSLDSVSS